jgi:hypothetical protein
MPRHRSIYTDTTKYQVVYKPEISTDLHCLLCLKCPCHPLSCLCFPNVSTKATESSYIHVYPNRLEYNYPLSTIAWDCTCHIVDNVKTIYYDRKQIDEIYALDGCICGYDKTVVVKGSCMSCSDVEAEQCCGRIFLPCVEDAPGLVQIIQECKSKRLTELQFITTMDRNTPPTRSSIDTGSTFTARESSVVSKDAVIVTKNGLDTGSTFTTRETVAAPIVRESNKINIPQQKRSSIIDNSNVTTNPSSNQTSNVTTNPSVNPSSVIRSPGDTIVEQKEHDKTTITIDHDNNVIIHFDNNDKKKEQKEQKEQIEQV